MGFWNSNKDKKEKNSKEQAQKVDRASANQKTPAVLAGTEPSRSVATTSPTMESKDAGKPASASSPNHSPRTEEGLIERYGVIRSALGKGTVIQGKLSFDTPVRIDGSLTGDVYSSQVLIVGETGNIEADIEVDALIVMGKVRGKIKAHKRVELWAGGVLEGEISTPALVIEENSKFNAQCSMERSIERGAAGLTAEKGSSRQVSGEKKSSSSSAANPVDASKEVRVH